MHEYHCVFIIFRGTCILNFILRSAKLRNYRLSEIESGVWHSGTFGGRNISFCLCQKLPFLRLFISLILIRPTYVTLGRFVKLPADSFLDFLNAISNGQFFEGTELTSTFTITKVSDTIEREGVKLNERAHAKVSCSLGQECQETFRVSS